MAGYIRDTKIPERVWFRLNQSEIALSGTFKVRESRDQAKAYTGFSLHSQAETGLIALRHLMFERAIHV
jgi:hypothetical protein